MEVHMSNVSEETVVSEPAASDPILKKAASILGLLAIGLLITVFALIHYGAGQQEKGYKRGVQEGRDQLKGVPLSVEDLELNRTFYRSSEALEDGRVGCIQWLQVDGIGVGSRVVKSRKPLPAQFQIVEAFGDKWIVTEGKMLPFKDYNIAPTIK
jgi:hypothetical protein